MKRLLSLVAAAIIACGYTQAQTDYTVKLSDDQVKALRNKIINEYEDQRANTMDWARFSRYAKDNQKITTPSQRDGWKRTASGSPTIISWAEASAVR